MPLGDPDLATLEPASQLDGPVSLADAATWGEPRAGVPARPPRHQPAQPAVTAGLSAYDLIVVGGVPGAGKTTAIATATDDLAHVEAVDPEHVSWWLRNRLPREVPYRAYRWVVHTVHTLRVLVALLDGPTVGRRLVIHDPGTRRRRRGLFLALARLAGWRMLLVYVDVDRSSAEDGQHRRGRVVRSFEEHWQSWQQLRPALTGDHRPEDGTEPVRLVGRADAAAVLRGLCLPSSDPPSRSVDGAPAQSQP